MPPRKEKFAAKGFTLVEVIVVCVILAILLAFSGASLAVYVSNEHFRRNDDYAKSFFVAAQTSLTHMKTSGQLEAFASDLKASSGSDQTGALTNTMVPGISEYGGRVYYLRKDKGELDEDGLIFRLLDSYVFDKTLLDEAVCIELDPSEGVVYSVFYSDASAELRYEGESAPSDSANLTERGETERRKVYLGYYGSESMTDAAPSSLGKPVISDVELINSTSLTLKWRMSSKFRILSNTFDYTLYIYDGSVKNPDESTPLMIITLAAGTATTGISEGSTVRIYNSDGSSTEYSAANGDEFGFSYYQDASDKSMKLILDAIDTDGETAENAGELSDTMSFARFGIEPDSIYVRVQASGVGYKNSVWRQSNTESPFFGECKYDKSGEYISLDGGRYFTITNARHLYNIRHMENGIASPGENSGHRYVQTAAFSWKSMLVTDGPSGSVWLRDGDEYYPTDDAATAFPPIQFLGADSVFYSSAFLITCRITDFILGGEAMDDVGLFAENYGSISDITLRSVYASGKDRVGALCAVNFGSLENISSSDGSVTGNSCVGGICGEDGRNCLYARSYAALSNSSGVYGAEYVGGIVGRVYGTVRLGSENHLPGAELRTTVSDCKNTGKIVGTEASEYLGGITGYNASAVITGCSNSPVYTNAEIEAISSREVMNTLLNGSYVGGIAGCNTADGIVADCSTGTGYMLGGVYVGGIIGYQLTEGRAITLDGLDTDGKMSENRTNVIGRSYVGGIVGAVMAEDGEDGSRLVISNWKNTGLVAGTQSYIGGIAGYNCGTIISCPVDIDKTYYTTAQLSALIGKWSAEADYVGGIAGANSGSIVGSASGVSSGVATILSGRNCVGGIVGINLAGGSVSGYEFTGGTLSGELFVGGIAGANLAPELFESGEVVVSKPNSISGTYFVGGVVGANLLSVENSGENVVNICAALGQKNNPLGAITARGAFAGGICGYICVVDKASENAEELLEKLAGCTESGELEQVVEAVEALREDQSVCEASVVIGGAADEQFLADISKISAGVCAGGVVGCCDPRTRLSVVNVCNNTRVECSSTVDFEGGLYSYAGGIIGKNPEYSVIESCSNGTKSQVTGGGTYTGGLVEYNVGIIRSCSASTIGSAIISRIGGIAGLNASKGRIYDCSLGGAVITGSDIVGGFAAVNFGVISSETASGSYEVGGSVNSSGSRAGGIAGINEESGVISGAVLTGIKVTAADKYAGGVAGENYGVISGCQSDSSSRVSAGSCAGGFAGIDGGTLNLKDLVNRAKVECDSDNAGGIVGEVSAEGNITLSGCINEGEVNAKKGSAGGIIPVVPSNLTVESCIGDGSVKAPTGKAGGIAAINRGTISDCEVGTSEFESGLADDQRSYVSGQRISGGIAAENRGTIDGCVNTAYIVKSAAEASGTIATGGIAGENYSVIRNCSAKDGARILCMINGSSVGGIAGINYSYKNGLGETISATITGTDSGKSGVSCVITDESRSYMGKFGGICGDNRGEISGYSFTGTLYGGNGQDGYGYGGISGVNTGSVSGCATNGTVWAEGAKGSTAYIGGISGVNGTQASASAVIEDCTVGESLIYAGKSAVNPGSDTSADAFIGGIAGENFAIVRNCALLDGENGYYYKSGAFYTSGGISVTNKSHTAEKLLVSAATGHVGGIIGQNEQNGQVDNCSTGEGWLVWQRSHQTDNTAAGIIGRSVSDFSVTYCVNRAGVYKSTSASNAVAGIVGRVENTSSNTWSYENCVNYGAVYGKERVGGIAGQIKNKGGTFTGCENYGEVSCSGTGKAGIVAMLYMLAADERLTIIDCSNHGAVSGGCGILDNVSATCPSSVVINIINCVNTGAVTSGITAGSNVCTSNIERCRNYGSCAGNAIVNTGYSKVSLRNCANFYPGKALASTDDCIDELCYRFNSKITYGSSLKLINLYTSGIATDSADKLIVTSGSSNLWKGETDEAGGDIYLIYNGKFTPESVEIISGTGCCGFSYQIFTMSDVGEILDSFDGVFYPVDSSSSDLLPLENAQSTRSVIIRVTPDDPDDTSLVIDRILVNGVSSFDNTGAGTDPETGLNQPIVASTVNGVSYLMDYCGRLWFSDIKTVPTTAYQPLSEIDGKYQYLYIDDQLAFYYDTVVYAAKNVDPPVISGVSDDGGVYTVGWNQIGGIYAYKLVISSADGSFEDIIIYSDVINQARWKLPEKLYGKLAVLSVYAVYSKASGAAAEQLSEPSTQKTIAVREPLPTPDAHTEVISVSTVSGAFSWQISNKDDYADKECAIDIRILSASNNSCPSGNSQTVNSFYGYLIADSVTATRGTEYRFTAQAVSEATPENTDLTIKYGNSMTTAMQGYTYKSTDVTGSTLFSGATFNGHKGISPLTLSYDLSITQKSGTETFCRSEYVAENYKGFSEIAVASSVQRVSGTGNTTTNVSLDGLPDDITLCDKVTVRTYAWCTQNDVQRYYHLAGGLDDLSGLDSDGLIDGLLTIDEVLALRDRSTLAPGDSTSEGVQVVTIETDADGNTVYKVADGYIVEYIPVTVDENTYDRYRVYFSIIVSGYKKNTISASKNVIRVQSCDISSLRADLPELLPRKVENDTDPVTYTEYGYLETSSGYVFMWDCADGYDDWSDITTSDYLSYRKDSSKRYSVIVTGIPADSEDDSTEAGADSVTILSSDNTSDNYVVLSKYNWSYKEVIVKIVALGTLDSSNEYAKTLPGITEITIPVRIPLTTIPMPQVQLADKNDLIYDVTWTPVSSQKDKTGSFTVYAYDESDPDNPVLAAMSTTAEGEWSASMTCKLDFADVTYYDGITLKIYVIANPSEQYSGTYTSSAYDAPYTLALPKRMDLPDIAKLVLTPCYPESITSAKFVDGSLKLGYVDAAVTDTLGGKYELEYQLYSALPDESNIGSSEVMVGSSVSLTMNGSLGSSSYSFGADAMSTDYAGYWLRIRIRAVSDGVISSAWTDYSVLRLPKIKFDAPELSYSTRSYGITVVNFNRSGGTEIDSTENLADTVAFKASDNAVKYLITIGDMSYTVDLSDPAGAETLYLSPLKLWTDKITYARLYQTAAQSLVIGQNASGETVCTITLRNMQSVINEDYTGWYVTSPSVTVTAVPTDSQSDRYDQSDASAWYAGHSNSDALPKRLPICMAPTVVWGEGRSCVVSWNTADPDHPESNYAGQMTSEESAAASEWVITVSDGVTAVNYRIQASGLMSAELDLSAFAWDSDLTVSVRAISGDAGWLDGLDGIQSSDVKAPSDPQTTP